MYTCAMNSYSLAMQIWILLPLKILGSRALSLQCS